MYIRPASEVTVGTLAEQLSTERSQTERVSADTVDVEFHLDAADPTVSLGDAKEVPATSATLSTFADYLGIPSSFADRARTTVQPATMSALLTDLMRHKGGGIKSFWVSLGGDGPLAGIYDPNHQPFDTSRMVERAGEVLGTLDAPIERLVNTADDFSFDVRVPDGYERGIGGDKPTKNKVGDVTAAGFRAGVDLKRGLAPWTEPWFYRLFCTNGCGTVESGLRLDARGQTFDEIIAELGLRYADAFRMADERIGHYYDLRNQRVDNPERRVRAIGRERGIPDRSINRMLDRIPTEPDFESDVTEFDIVNLITNEANNPALTRDGGRLLLERVGGAVVADHSATCTHCNQAIRH